MKRLGIRTQSTVVPGVGADWTITVPQGKNWRILAARSLFTASAGAANREVRLLVNHPSGNPIYAFIPSGTTQIATEVRTYQWLNSGGYRGPGSVNVGIVVGIGDLIVPSGHIIRASTTNIQAGDQWEACHFLIEELG